MVNDVRKVLPIAISESLSTLETRLAKSDATTYSIVDYLRNSAFAYFCRSHEIAEIRAREAYGDAMAVVILGEEEDINSGFEAGADRVLENYDPDKIEHLLRELENQWQRAIVARHHKLSTAAVISNMSESVELTSIDVQIEYVNPAFEDRTGYTLEQALGKTPAQILRSSKHDAKLYENMEATSRRGEIWRGELLGRHRDGSEHYTLATIIPVLDNEGVIVKFCSLKQSLRIEKVDKGQADGGRRALLQLVKSQERYRNLVDAAEDCLIVSDFGSGQILTANQATSDSFGYSHSELRHQNFRALSLESEHSTIDSTLSELEKFGKAEIAKIRMCRSDGSEFWGSTRHRVFSTHGQTCFLTVLRDISEEVERARELEAAKKKVAHGTRLAVVGRVAAGVAHEINNPATIVKHNLEFMSELLDGIQADTHFSERACLSEWREMISDASIGIGRIQTVTQQLLGFTQDHHRGKSAVKINTAIEMALRFVRNEIDHRADLVLQLDEITPLWLDESRVGQLFVNLLVNAVQSIAPGRRKDNRIRVETKEEEGDVYVLFCDTGCGMSEKVLQQALDPFFSTKQAGKGTGLGLALCSETVSSYEGRMTVRSTEGEGTCVEIRIPTDKNRIPDVGQN